jgi:hypothetical protein
VKAVTLTERWLPCASGSTSGSTVAAQVAAQVAVLGVDSGSQREVSRSAVNDTESQTQPKRGGHGHLPRRPISGRALDHDGSCLGSEQSKAGARRDPDTVMVMVMVSHGQHAHHDKSNPKPPLPANAHTHTQYSLWLAFGPPTLVSCLLSPVSLLPHTSASTPAPASACLTLPRLSCLILPPASPADPIADRQTRRPHHPPPNTCSISPSPSPSAPSPLRTQLSARSTHPRSLCAAAPIVFPTHAL